MLTGTATMATLAILALAYTRMAAHFPHGGGGYTAAKQVVHRRVALVSGVALVFDAALDVAVSAVTCVEAVTAVLPAGGGAARLPTALVLVLALAALNLRGVRESVAVLVPVLLAFVLSHVVVLGLGIAARAGELPAVVSPVWRDLHGLVRERGVLGALGTAGRAYALRRHLHQPRVDLLSVFVTFTISQGPCSGTRCAAAGRRGAGRRTRRCTRSRWRSLP
jgi:hypothetical protein